MGVHIPATITEDLRKRQIDLLKSQEDGTCEVDDDVLLVLRTDLPNMRHVPILNAVEVEQE